MVERPIHNLEVAGSNLGEEGEDGKVDWTVEDSSEERRNASVGKFLF